MPPDNYVCLACSSWALEQVGIGKATNTEGAGWTLVLCCSIPTWMTVRASPSTGSDFENQQSKPALGHHTSVRKVPSQHGTQKTKGRKAEACSAHGP